MTTLFASAHRFILRSSCCLALTVVPCLAPAGESEPSEVVTTERYQNPCHLELSGTEEYCGWVELGTHDSVTLPTPAKKIPALPVSSIDSSVTVLATAACAGAGISVEQIVEPFAMVGPYLDNSLEAVNKLQQWWKVAMEESERLRPSIDEAVDVLAELEPLDIETFGPSVISSAAVKEERQPVIEITSDSFVGTSPMIVTLEEAYLPYDLAANDIQLWSVFPVTTRPFCVRRRAAQSLTAQEMWEEAERIVERSVQVIRATEVYAHCGFADCNLDELIWKLDNLLAQESQLWDAMKPDAIGRRFAALAFSGNSLVKNAAGLLASRWPEVTEGDVSPSPAGAALLARAGLIDATENVAADEQIAVPEAQVAEIVPATSIR